MADFKMLMAKQRKEKSNKSNKNKTNEHRNCYMGFANPNFFGDFFFVCHTLLFCQVES